MKVEIVRTVMLVAVRFPNPLYEVKRVGESDLDVDGSPIYWSNWLSKPPGCLSNRQLMEDNCHSI